MKLYIYIIYIYILYIEQYTWFFSDLEECQGNRSDTQNDIAVVQCDEVFLSIAFQIWMVSMMMKLKLA